MTLTNKTLTISQKRSETKDMSGKMKNTFIALVCPSMSPPQQILVTRKEIYNTLKE